MTLSDTTEHVTESGPALDETTAPPQNPDASAPPRAETEQSEQDEARRRQTNSERRISRLVREREQERAQRQQLERELQDLRQQPRQAQPSAGSGSSEEPDPSNYTDYATYQKDLMRWAAREEAKRTFEESQSASRAAEQRNAESEELGRQAARFHESADKLRETLPDLQEVIESIGDGTPELVQAIRESEFGPQVAYYLGANQEELDRILSMKGATRVAAAIGRLESKANEFVQSRGRSRANPQTPPLATSGAHPERGPSPSDSSDTWIRKRLAERARRR